MGFFDFFKKPKEKEPEKPISLALQEIPIFLDKKSQEINEQLTLLINQIKKELDSEITILKTNLATLESAEIKNTELPQRAKQIMEGNRHIYLSKTRALIEKISIPKETKEILLFTKNFDKELDNFDKVISKSHRILEEFFLEKAGAVATSIKKIDKLVKEISKIIESSALPTVQEIREKTNSLVDKINKSKQNNLLLEKLQKEIKELERETNQKEKHLVNLQQSEDFKSATHLIESKNESARQLERLNSEIKSRFSEISPALKKYENLSQNKLAKKYLEDAIQALVEDNSLEILTILHATKTAIIKGEITLKEEKKSRIMNELFNLNEESFKNYLAKRKELISIQEEKTLQIQNYQILKETANLENSTNQDKISLQEKISTLDKMKKSFEDIDLNRLKLDIETDLKEKLNLEIKVI